MPDKTEKSNSNSTVGAAMNDLLSRPEWEIRSFRYGDIVEGIVVSKSKNELLVDIGGKSEGMVTDKELEDSFDTFRNLKIGDPVLCFVLHAEDEQGYVVLSLRRAEAEKIWMELKRSMTDEIPMDVKVLDYNKGGLLVELGAIRGFIPVSHIDRVHFPDNSGRGDQGFRGGRDDTLSSMVGMNLQAVVIELDRRENRLIMSEKLAHAGRSKGEQREAMDKMKVGDVLTGTVTAVLPFGIFVDLQGIEGLVHISELSWGKVSDPQEHYQKGQEVQVKVTEIDLENNKVSLSIKDLLDDPWKESHGRYSVGETTKGLVTKITPYGAFIRLEEGMDGLIHISETTGPLVEGETITAKIISFDPEQRKLGLSMKQMEGQPKTQNAKPKTTKTKTKKVSKEGAEETPVESES